jgi:hypothetical protein
MVFGLSITNEPAPSAASAAPTRPYASREKCRQESPPPREKLMKPARPFPFLDLDRLKSIEEIATHVLRTESSTWSEGFLLIALSPHGSGHRVAQKILVEHTIHCVEKSIVEYHGERSEKSLGNSVSSVCERPFAASGARVRKKYLKRQRRLMRQISRQ